jgi:ABC-type polysaccharide/polyol phosphate transport system, ATPase component
MDENCVIQVNGVSKSFRSRQQKTIRESIKNIGSTKTKPKKILDDVSFELKKGESLGIIGSNGAGKSTLMKIIAGVMEPDEGEIRKKGRIASLLELGIGFHNELSGRENIFVKGSTFGFSKKEIENRIEKIIEFSEIEDFIDEPIKIYSSGMSARLAFAIAINVDADIILADEIFSVGDMAFKEKCTNTFRKMRRNGTSIIIVSHGMGTIREMCDNVLWLRDGKIFDSGNCKRVCDHYESEEGESFKATLRLAKEGNAQAQNKLAIMHREGRGTDIDYTEALKWFTLAAEQKNMEAQRNLADMISKGLGAEQNHTEALKWFTLAAEQGDIGAMTRVASSYKDGIGVAVNRGEALKWYTELAERGNANAQFILGNIILNGGSANQTPEEAFKWYLKSAEAGNNSSRFQVAVMFREGLGTEKNIKNAIGWFNLAAAQGNTNAQMALMEILLSSEAAQCEDIDIEEELNVTIEQVRGLAESGNVIAQKNLAKGLLSGVGIRQDSAMALEWYLKAAKAGDSAARHQVGLMYRDGLGTDRDLDEAISWFNLAAEQKNGGAIEALARMLLNGEGMEKDERLAFQRYKDVADSGNMWARNQVGLMYRDGIGTERNNEEAKKYFKASGEQGNVLARINLANLAATSKSDEDIKLAFCMYHKVAETGNALASYKIGIMYRDGIGTDMNIELARKWLRIAAEKQNNEARTELEKLNDSS